MNGRTGETRNNRKPSASTDTVDFITRCTEAMDRMHGFTGGSTAFGPVRTMSNADLRAPASQYLAAQTTYLPTAALTQEAGNSCLTSLDFAAVATSGPAIAGQFSRSTVVRFGASNPPNQVELLRPMPAAVQDTARNLAIMSRAILGHTSPSRYLPTSLRDDAPSAVAGRSEQDAPAEYLRPCTHAAADRMWERLTDGCTPGAQGFFPLGGVRVTPQRPRPKAPPPPPGACLQCHSTKFETSCGESTCTQCGVVRLYTERIGRSRNGGGPEDEDNTVRADAPRAPRRFTPAASAADQRNQMREKLDISNANMPRGLVVVQRISEASSINEALRQESVETTRALQLKGFRLQAELTKHLNTSYRLTPDMADRARATAQAAWQRIEAHHATCTVHRCAQRPCHRDLSGCPAALLSLICLSICIDETLLEATASNNDGGGVLEALGGFTALSEAAAFVRTHMLNIGTANEKNTNRTLVIARQLMDDTVVARRCDALHRPAEEPLSCTGRLVAHAHLAATSKGGSVAASMRHREVHSEPSDDSSSVSSLGIDLPSSPSQRIGTVSSVRQAFAALHQQRNLRMTTTTTQETMRAIKSPQFCAALRDDEFVRSQSPSALAAALAYNATIGELLTVPSNCAAAPIRQNRANTAPFAVAAKMDPATFRATARKVAELQWSERA